MDEQDAPSSSQAARLQRLDRRRVGKACDSCRRRKERCDGSRPVCSQCHNGGRRCSYAIDSKKRGLPEGWVHGLEKLLALLLASSPANELVLNTVFTKGLESPDESGFSLLWHEDSKNDLSLLKMWRSSRIAKYFESVLPALERLPDARNEALAVQKARSYLQQLPKDSAQLLNSITDDLTIIHGVEESSPIPIDPGEAAHNTQTINHNRIEVPQVHPTTIQLPPNSLQLIEYHFNVIQPCLPILEKHEIYRMYHQHWAGSYDKPSNSSDETSCLLAMFVCAVTSDARYGSILPALSSEISIEMTRNPSCLLHGGRQSPSLRTAQAAVFVALSLVNLDRWQEAWTAIGQATRHILLAEACNSRLISGSGSEPRPETVSRVQHTKLCCFVLDVGISAKLSLPPHILDDGSTVLECILEDGIDEWCTTSHPCLPQGYFAHPLQSISNFNDLVAIVKLYLRTMNVLKAQPVSADVLHNIMSELASLKHERFDTYQTADGLHDKFLCRLMPHQVAVLILFTVTQYSAAVHFHQLTSPNWERSKTAEHVIDDLINVLTNNPDCHELMPTLSWFESMLDNFVRDIQLGLHVGAILSDRVRNLGNVIQSSATDSCFGQFSQRLRETQQQVLGSSDIVYQHAQLESLEPFQMAVQETSMELEPEPEPYQLDDIPTAQEAAKPFLNDVRMQTTTSNNEAFGRLPQENVSDSGSAILDFVTLDAMNLEGGWFHSLQNLGFADTDDINLTLQSFLEPH